MVNISQKIRPEKKLVRIQICFIEFLYYKKLPRRVLQGTF
jgi:hypothetical protein